MKAEVRKDASTLCPPWRTNVCVSTRQFYPLGRVRASQPQCQPGSLIREEALLGNTCLLRNVIWFLFCFTKCVLTRKRAEDSQIPRLVLFLQLILLGKN